MQINENQSLLYCTWQAFLFIKETFEKVYSYSKALKFPGIDLKLLGTENKSLSFYHIQH